MVTPPKFPLKMKIKGYLAQLDEWEDDAFALFNEPQKDNQYTYSDNPSHDLREILENYLGKNITIEIK